MTLSWDRSMNNYFSEFKGAGLKKFCGNDKWYHIIILNCFLFKIN